jgi:hypothetical protein
MMIHIVFRDKVIVSGDFIRFQIQLLDKNKKKRVQMGKIIQWLPKDNDPM